MINSTDYIAIFVGAIILFLIMKPFWQWYYDITEIKKNQKEQIEILKEISNKLDKDITQ